MEEGDVSSVKASPRGEEMSRVTLATESLGVLLSCLLVIHQTALRAYLYTIGQRKGGFHQLERALTGFLCENGLDRRNRCFDFPLKKGSCLVWFVSSSSSSNIAINRFAFPSIPPSSSNQYGCNS